MNQITIALAACGLSIPLAGQWLNYPTPVIPRTADGKPNLSAPAPKMPDGKPDLSGVWEHLNARTTAYYLDGIEIPWQPWAKAVFDERTADNQKDNPESQCLPRGIPKADAFDIHKIVQTPTLILILYEYQTTFRQIFLDGRVLRERSQSDLGGVLGRTLGGRHAGGGIQAASTGRLGFPDAAIRLRTPYM